MFWHEYDDRTPTEKAAETKRKTEEMQIIFGDERPSLGKGVALIIYGFAAISLIIFLCSHFGPGPILPGGR